jgi:iron complex transport system ATP-binding protein
MELAIDNLTKEYDGVRALDGVSLRVRAGEILGLVGPNGSGKSTLIRMAAAILSKTSGSVQINGNDVFRMDPADLARMVGYVPQLFTYTRYMTVFEMVLLGRRPHIRWSVTDDELARVQHALDTLEIAGLAGKYLDELSGGERQKVFIARAIAQEPALLLLDEPTAAQDIRHQIEVMEIMRDLARKRNAAMVMAVHDLNLAYRYADTVLVLRNGKIAGYGPPRDILTPERIGEVYGVDALILPTPAGDVIVPVRVQKR